MKTILIIEDHAPIAMIIKEFLGDEGYEAETVQDGLSGLKRLKIMPKPDLVMVDLNMPGMNGREVIEEIRSDIGLKDMPIIITTGAVYNREDFPLEGTYQAIIQKPFELASILNCIEKILK